MKVLLGLFTCILFISFVPYNWSEKLTEKVHDAISITYEIEGYTYDKYDLPIDLDLASKDVLKDKLYSLMKSNELVGYFYVSQAPSMKNVFDYIVLFNEKWEIVNSKVLIYRENHGRQIGSNRWLSQFDGMKPGDKPMLSRNVDGISGATISCTSMTQAVASLLQSVNQMKLVDAR